MVVKENRAWCDFTWGDLGVTSGRRPQGDLGLRVLVRGQRKCEDPRAGRSFMFTGCLLEAFPGRESHSIVWLPKQPVAFLADL